MTKKARCNHPLGTKFPVSVTKQATSGSQGPFSGMMQGSVNVPLQISTHSQIKEKHLLSLDDCSRFYCIFVLLYIDYNLIQFTYTNFAIGAGHRVLICSCINQYD